MKHLLLLFLALISVGTNAQKLDHSLIKQLSQRSEIQTAKISPTGIYLALGVIKEDTQVISVLDLASNTFISHVRLPRENEFGDFFWANSERIVAKVMVKHSWQEFSSDNGELYAFNYDGSHQKLIYGYRTGKMQTGTSIKQRKSTYGWARVIDTLYNDPQHILISSTPWSKSGSKKASVVRLNIYKGKQRKGSHLSPISYAQFLTKNDGSLGLVQGIDENNKKHLYWLENNKDWQEILFNQNTDKVIPLSFDDSGENVYVVSDFGKDKKGLYKLNLMTGKQKSIFTDANVDIADYEQSTIDNQIYALRLDNGLPEYIMVNKNHEEAKVFKQLLASFPNSQISITSKTRVSDKFVFSVSSDTDPGSIYLYDKQKNQLKFLFAYRSQVNKKGFMKSEPFQFITSDNTTIRGYFTPAKNYQSDKVKKMVVLVHGGPQHRDSWLFDSDVHILSQHGYSVLRVNFRGSTGYGTAFEQSGFQQWGGDIQEDIAEAVDWAISNKNISAEKVCITGHSFGGYSAVMNPINYPEKYQCAVASMGVYDLPLMYEEGDITQLKFATSFLNTVLGIDKKIQQKMSPAFNVNKLKTPLFIFHGNKDWRAPIEQAESLLDALNKAKKPYQYHFFDKEGHGFYNPESRITFYTKMLTFLDKHLAD
jgi:dipeptidyl aminopeptidase/acylaminoacyl peptidase